MRSSAYDTLARLYSLPSVVTQPEDPRKTPGLRNPYSRAPDGTSTPGDRSRRGSTAVEHLLERDRAHNRARAVISSGQLRSSTTIMF
jgi:hypothetical protein